MKISLKRPSRKIFPFATQLSATPPARQRFSDGWSCFARFLSEQFLHLLPRHSQSVFISEVLHVECKTSVLLYIDEFLDMISVLRFAIRSKSHYLVFSAVHLKTEIVGDCGVEETERMGKVNFLREFHVRSSSIAHGCRCPFANAIDRNDGCVRKSAAVVRRCCVRFEMGGEVNGAFVLQFFFNVVRDPELFCHPFLHRAMIRNESFWPNFEIGIQDAVKKFQKRFFIKANGIDVMYGDTGVLQCMFDCL